MTKKYDMCEHEELDQKVQDDSVMEYTTTQSPPYTMEQENNRAFVQADTKLEYAISETISEILPPYTIEELKARINEAEEQIARGEVLTEEEAELEFERFLATL